MKHNITETTVRLEGIYQDASAVDNMEHAMRRHFDIGEAPVRAAVVGHLGDVVECEVAALSGVDRYRKPADMLAFRQRERENAERFNAVLVVPTGIGCEIGGHAGDASPVAHLLAAACDTLITHPNVLNASDLIQVPPNCLYVEGSALARLMQGTLSLARVRNNRLLVLLGPHDEEMFINGAINAVNAARATYGMPEPIVVQLEDGPVMETEFRESGRAAGTVSGLDGMFQVIERRRGQFDAVAIASQIRIPPEYYDLYFSAESDLVNPWGGVEAMLTHAVTGLYDVPSAHAPMIESLEVINDDPGVVDPRMAAEAVSFTLIQCVLRGLQYSPRLVPHGRFPVRENLIGAEDLSCLVIPDGCVGLPTLAALQQRIPVIAVRENRNLMKNDLRALPWAPGQLHHAENYWEAAGIMTALRHGIDPSSVRRPLALAPVQRA